MAHVGERYGLSERRACGLMRLARSTRFYRSVKTDDVVLRMRLRELAAARPRFGYRRLYVLLRREGWTINHKKVYRVSGEEGLLVRTKRRRKHVSRSRVPLPAASGPRERWSMDFVCDGLVGNRRIRIFAAIDDHTRECVCLEAGHTMSSKTVTSALDRAIARYQKPYGLTCDNGTEFTSNHFDAWAHHQRIDVNFISPGRPMDNGLIESFNGRLRDECLNVNWFESLDDARRILQRWRRDYNETRPHSSIGDLAPAVYAAKLLTWNAA